MNYKTLPESLRNGARLYIENGIEPGSFLRAALENKLVEAFSCADSGNIARMFDIVSWLYNECPVQARGSRKAVTAWIAHKEMQENQEPNLESPNPASDDFMNDYLDDEYEDYKYET